MKLNIETGAKILSIINSNELVDAMIRESYGDSTTSSLGDDSEVEIDDKEVAYYVEECFVVYYRGGDARPDGVKGHHYNEDQVLILELVCDNMLFEVWF